MKTVKGITILRRSCSTAEIADFFLAPKLRPDLILELLLHKHDNDEEDRRADAHSSAPGPAYPKVMRWLRSRWLRVSAMSMLILTLISCAFVAGPALQRDRINTFIDQYLDALTGETSLIKAWWNLIGPVWPSFSRLSGYSTSDDTAFAHIMRNDVMALFMMDSDHNIINVASQGNIFKARDTIRHLSDLQQENISLSQKLESLRDTIDGKKIYVELYLAANRLKVKMGAQELYAFPIVSGKGMRYLAGSGDYKNFATPNGIREVVAKERDPVWYKPDWFWTEKGEQVPESLAMQDRAVRGELGKYRLNLGDGIGIHGTRAGKIRPGRFSHGCIRMNEADLEVLFNIVDVGTEVYIY